MTKFKKDWSYTIKKNKNKRLMELGLVPGASMTYIGCALLGDPKLFLVRGTLLALRSKDIKTFIELDDERLRC